MVCSAHVITWEWQWPTKFALLPLSQFMHANIEKKNMHVDFIATHKFLVCIELKMPHATFCMQPVNMNLHRVHLTNSSTNFSKNESYVDDAMILNLSTWLNLCSRIYVPKVGNSYLHTYFSIIHDIKLPKVYPRLEHWSFWRTYVWALNYSHIYVELFAVPFLYELLKHRHTSLLSYIHSNEFNYDWKSTSVFTVRKLLYAAFDVTFYSCTYVSICVYIFCRRVNVLAYSQNRK